MCLEEKGDSANKKHQNNISWHHIKGFVPA